MSAKYKSPSFLLPNELNTSANTANDTGINSLYSMDFDGSNYIDTGFVPANNLTLNCSISAWVNMPAINNNVNSSILGTYDFGGSRARFFLRIYRTSNVYYYMIGLGTVQDITVAISNFSVNTWVHLAVTYDGTNIRLYSNGTLDGTINAGNIGPYPPITSGFDGISYIGATHRSSGANTEAHITGKIDEVAIFNKALNTTEIAALYDGTGSNIRPSNLIASNLNPIVYYPLGEQAQMQGYLGNEASSEWQFPNGVLQDYVLDFDGVNDLIDVSSAVSSISSSATGTVSGWIKYTTGGSTAYMITFTSNTNTSQQYLTFQGNSNGVAYAQIKNQWILQTNNAVFTSGNWYHFVVTQNGTEPKIYINGTEYSNGNGAALTTYGGTDGTEWWPNLSDFNTVTMGGMIWNNGSLQTLYGNQELSNIQIFNSALPATGSNSIETLYNNGSPLTSMTGFTSLINWWKLNATSVYTPSAPNYTTALDFDGADDYIDCGTSQLVDFNSSFTISAWVYITSTASGYDAVYAFKGASHAFVMFFNNGSGYSPISFGSANYLGGDGTIRCATNVTINQWNNIVVVYNGNGITSPSNYTFYINNKSQTLTTSSGFSNVVNANYIGRYDPSHDFDGSISNVAVFNSALSPSQVSTLFNFGTPETNISFSPQAWWKLDNTTTGIQDSSGNGNNGTNNGATQVSSSVAVVPSWKIPSALPITTTPNYTTALDFDGNDYIDCGSSSNLELQTISVSFWIKETQSASSLVGVVAKNQGSNVGWIIWVDANNLRWQVGDGSNDSFNGSIVNNFRSYAFLNQWNNICCTFDGTVAKIYINNVLHKTWTASSSYSIDYTNVGNLNIGKRPDRTTPKINASLSNVSIFNSALTASQVSTLYNGGTPETTISFSPVSWWKLDTGGSTITDYGSGGNNGTNNGTATQITSDVLATQPVNGVSTTLPSTALQQSDLQFDSPYSNYSLYFDGASSRVQALYNLPSGVTKFSVSIWGNVEGAGSSVNKCLISNENSNSADGYALFTEGTYPNTKVWFKIENNTSTQTTSNIVFGEWFHVLGTYDNGTAKIYFNGVLEDTTTGVPAINTSSLVSTMIGSYRESNPIIPMLGHLDEAAIWETVALTDAQVLQIYNNGKPNDISSLSPTNWWRLGENAYFNNGNKIVTPNSIIGGVNGIGSGTVNDSLSANAPGTYANGVGSDLDIVDRVGDAPLSVANSQSYNMIPDDKIPYVPGYVGNQISNTYSMTFDGVDDYFDLGTGLKSTFDGATAFTISAWFKYDTANPNYSTIIQQEYTVAGDSYLAAIRLTNTSTPQISNRNVTLTDTTALNSGQWYHIASVFDGSSQTLTMYIDGTQITQNTSAGSSMPTSAAGSKCIIGANANNDRFLDGSIDEVAIFDKALTADQVKFDLYDATTTGKTADIANNPNLPTPVAWYRMGD